MGRKKTELDVLARKELEAYYTRRWTECRENHWPKWPLQAKLLDTLVRASLSHQIGCKGGLVNELGRSNSNYDTQVRTLQSEGMIVEVGFVPTALGWSMLEKFAKNRSRFPKDYVFTIGDRAAPPEIPYESEIGNVMYKSHENRFPKR